MPTAQPDAFKVQTEQPARHDKDYESQTAKKERKNLRNHKSSDIVAILSRLGNQGFQRGIAWRADKLDAIIEARKYNVPEETIYKRLLKTGVTHEKVRELMRTATDIEEE